jgi:hypothetical protein
MEILKLENFWGFVFLFLPGFISVKTYHSMVASDKYDFSKDLFELVGYSLLNLIFNSWLILLNIKYDWIFKLNLYLYFSSIWILLICPVLWPLLIKYLLSLPISKKYLLGNKKSAWDFYFNQREGTWIIINLKNGKRVGGNYSDKSYATSYPCGESIFLEEQWELWDKTDNRKFKNKAESTGGVLVLSDNIESIEFYK